MLLLLEYTGWTILSAHMKIINNFLFPLTIEAIFCGVIEDACPVVLGGVPGLGREGVLKIFALDLQKTWTKLA